MEIPAEFGLDEVVGGDHGNVLKVSLDDAGCLLGALQGAGEDDAHRRVAEEAAEGLSLIDAPRAQPEAGEVPIDDAPGVFHITVADEITAGWYGRWLGGPSLHVCQGSPPMIGTKRSPTRHPRQLAPTVHDGRRRTPWRPRECRIAALQGVSTRVGDGERQAGAARETMPDGQAPLAQWTRAAPF